MRQLLATWFVAGAIVASGIMPATAVSAPAQPNATKARVVAAPRATVPSGIPGERYVLAGRFPRSAAHRVVELERLDGKGRWVFYWSKRLDSQGQYRFGAWADQRPATWRVIAPRVRTQHVLRRVIRTQRVIVPVAQQRITASPVPLTAARGAILPITSFVTPARPGRPVELTLKSRDGSWEQEFTASQDASGSASFEVALFRYGALDLSVTARAHKDTQAVTQPIGSVRVTPSLAPELIGHRGGNYAPENTMANFQAAIAGGVRCLETDIRRTQDGHWVLMHDADVRRTTDAAAVFPGQQSYSVSSFTLAEILQLSAGAPGVKVPTLEDFFQLVSDSGVEAVIDPKIAITPPLALELDSLARSYPGLVTPGDDDLLVWSINSRPTGLSVSSAIPDGRRALVVVNAWPDDDTMLDYESVSVDQALLTPSDVVRAHALGVDVTVWTVNDTQSVGVFSDMGVDAIFTDDITMARGVLPEG